MTLRQICVVVIACNFERTKKKPIEQYISEMLDIHITCDRMRLFMLLSLCVFMYSDFVVAFGPRATLIRYRTSSE